MLLIGFPTKDSIMINSASQIPFHTPAVSSSSAAARPVISAQELTTDLDISAALDEAINDAIARGNEQAPALAANLLRMVNENPEALDLYLVNVSEQRQRNLTSALSITAYASANAADSSSDALGRFGKVLETVGKRNDEANGKTLGTYTKYMVALTELATKINSLIYADPKDAGKSVVNSNQIIDAVKAFCETWGAKTDANGNDVNVLGVFSDKSAADKEAERFRGGTVEVFPDKRDNKFKLRFSFTKLIPIINALVNDKGTGETAKKITQGMREGKGPDVSTLTEKEWSDWGYLKKNGVNAHGVQTITLALSDVQKTHQTDLDLVLNEFTRQTSQFDNLVKLFSSLATTMTETLKSFL